MGEISESQLSDMREVYRDQTGKTIIYFAKWTPPVLPPNQPPNISYLEVAVKIIQTQGMIEPYTYIEEFSNQLRFDSPNVCKIYGWSIQPQRVIIVMERLQHDLAKYILMRRENWCYFSEDELFDMCKQVVGVFAEMQELNISHNDIKAENIFVNALGNQITYKVGDFGSAGTSRGSEHSLTGTPLYLSPLLKREYQRYNQTKERKEIYHNPFKSDVFSLGITFIFAAELIIPIDLLDQFKLNDKLEAHLSTISSRYPKFAQILRQMLITDESKRWDFITIKKELANLGILQSDFSARPLELTIPQFSTPKVDFNAIMELNRNYAEDKMELVRMLLQILDQDNNLAKVVAKLLKECRNCLSEIDINSLRCERCGTFTGEGSYIHS